MPAPDRRSGGPAERFAEILAREKAALRAGAIGALEGIADEKLRVFRIFQAGDLARGDVGRLRALAGENLRLLDAALGGFRAARHRIDEIGRAGAGLDTYDRLGRAGRIGSPALSVERRA
ncbi:MAG: hypothetical protein ACKVPY_03415 [Paracoccaceae bacterium]